MEAFRVWNHLCHISVIIQSLKDSPPLTDDSILFRSDGVALAKVGAPALKGVSVPIETSDPILSWLLPLGF